MAETIRDGDEMIRLMHPERVPGVFVFKTVSEAQLAALLPTVRAVFREAEGISVVVPAEPGTGGGMAQITLQVYSALDGVGLTAAVASALAKASVPCNVIAATQHDHIFVPEAQADKAVSVLKALSDDARKEG
ncbi:MAG: ACT domain-containing protein [Roseicyclus sp.]